MGLLPVPLRLVFSPDAPFFADSAAFSPFFPELAGGSSQYSLIEPIISPVIFFADPIALTPAQFIFFFRTWFHTYKLLLFRIWWLCGVPVKSVFGRRAPLVD